MSARLISKIYHLKIFIFTISTQGLLSIWE